MPDIQLFPLFGLLPKELREQIWQLSLEPRLIEWYYETYSLDITDPPNFLYLIGGYFPYTHFTMDAVERPEEPYRTGHLVPRHGAPPAALAVHRESRDFLIFLGYIPWTVENPLRGTRDVMWYPQLDVVTFPAQEYFSNRAHMPPYIEVFMLQFPSIVPMVQTLSVTATYLVSHKGFIKDHARFLLEFVSLSNIAVIMDEEYEPYLEPRSAVQSMSSEPWPLLNEIQELLEDSKALVVDPIGPQSSTPEFHLVWAKTVALNYRDAGQSQKLAWLHGHV